MKEKFSNYEIEIDLGLNKKDILIDVKWYVAGKIRYMNYWLTYTNDKELEYYKLSLDGIEPSLINADFKTTKEDTYIYDIKHIKNYLWEGNDPINILPSFRGRLTLNILKNKVA